MKVFTVIDNDMVNGIETYVYDSKEKAIQQFNFVINEYKESFGEFDQESDIEDTWAQLVVNSNVLGRIFWHENIVR